jgi:hypothetical protein
MTSATNAIAHFGGQRSNVVMTTSSPPKMKNRSEIYAADLYVVLQREFRRRQSADCDACYVQLPFRVDRRDPESPNWEVVIPPSCVHGCREAIEDLIAEFGLLYDLRLDDGQGRA